MKWFEGTIEEAVTTSKAKKAVFVVFIEGQDEASKEVTQTLNLPELSSRLESDKFVAIKLQSDSPNYTFFAQIYQLVPVPSIFFIGDNGTPLEIIGNALPAADLIIKIDSILEKAYPQATSSIDSVEAEQKAHSSNNSQDNGAKDSSNNGATNSETKPTTAVETPVAKEISQEEKIKRARELIEIQKKKKQEEEEKQKREREIDRRKTGKDVQKLRQLQQDKDFREMQQERLREKAADQAAKEKILKQIAEDKLERKRKYEMHLQEKNAQLEKKREEAAQKTKAQAPSVDLSKTRIQFKLPTGSPIIGTFDSTSTLGSLRSYVSQNAQLPFRQFSMSAFFPRKDFTTADEDKTLLELELAPSAVVLILPVKSSVPTTVIKSSDNSGVFSHFFWTLLAPVMSIYNYVMGFFTGRPRTGDPSNNDNRNPGSSSNSDNANVFGRLPNFGMRRLGNQGAKIRARGNVHSLHSNDDDNDENNTWNGNSTQQM